MGTLLENVHIFEISTFDFICLCSEQDCRALLNTEYTNFTIFKFYIPSYSISTAKSIAQLIIIIHPSCVFKEVKKWKMPVVQNKKQDYNAKSPHICVIKT